MKEKYVNYYLSRARGQCGGRIDLRNRDILAKKSRVCDQFLNKEQSVGICEECGHEIMLDPRIDRAIPPYVQNVEVQ